MDIDIYKYLYLGRDGPHVGDAIGDGRCAERERSPAGGDGDDDIERAEHPRDGAL